MKKAMTNRDVALEYLRCFCAGDIDGLASSIADGLRFTGPFHTYNSGAEYLAGLRKDPPEACEYKVLSLTENGDSVAVFYEYRKTKQVMQIAQLFGIREGKIHEVLLVFDGRGIGE